ncbi:hypothetical protein thsps21_05870 [Pseudomonas sp. No.21]
MHRAWSNTGRRVDPASPVHHAEWIGTQAPTGAPLVDVKSDVHPTPGSTCGAQNSRVLESCTRRGSPMETFHWFTEEL